MHKTIAYYEKIDRYNLRRSAVEVLRIISSLEALRPLMVNRV